MTFWGTVAAFIVGNVIVIFCKVYGRFKVCLMESENHHVSGISDVSRDHGRSNLFNKPSCFLDVSAVDCFCAVKDKLRILVFDVDGKGIYLKNDSPTVRSANECIEQLMEPEPDLGK